MMVVKVTSMMMLMLIIVSVFSRCAGSSCAGIEVKWVVHESMQWTTSQLQLLYRKTPQLLYRKTSQLHVPENFTITLPENLTIILPIVDGYRTKQIQLLYRKTSQFLYRRSCGGKRSESVFIEGLRTLSSLLHILSVMHPPPPDSRWLPLLCS